MCISIHSASAAADHLSEEILFNLAIKELLNFFQEQKKKRFFEHILRIKNQDITNFKDSIEYQEINIKLNEEEQKLFLLVLDKYRDAYIKTILQLKEDTRKTQKNKIKEIIKRENLEYTQKNKIKKLIHNIQKLIRFIFYLIFKKKLTIEEKISIAGIKGSKSLFISNEVNLEYESYLKNIKQIEDISEDTFIQINEMEGLHNGFIISIMNKSGLEHLKTLDKQIETIKYIIETNDLGERETRDNILNKINDYQKESEEIYNKFKQNTLQSQKNN